MSGGKSLIAACCRLWQRQKVHQDLPSAVLQLVHELRLSREDRRKEFEWSKSHHGLATKQDLEQLRTFMAATFKEFASEQNVALDNLSTDVDKLVESIGSVSVDVKDAVDLIKKLQTVPGVFTPEEQSLADQLQSKIGAAASKLATAKQVIADVDAQFPPPVEPVPEA